MTREQKTRLRSLKNNAPEYHGYILRLGALFVTITSAKGNIVQQKIDRRGYIVGSRSFGSKWDKNMIIKNLLEE